jgi:hypothetical protein
VNVCRSAATVPRPDYIGRGRRADIELRGTTKALESGEPEADEFPTGEI